MTSSVYCKAHYNYLSAQVSRGDWGYDPSLKKLLNWKSQNTVPDIPAVILPWETSSYSLVIKLKEEETYKYMTSKYQTWHSKQLVEIFSLWPKMLQSVPKWKDFVLNRVKVEGLSSTILLLLSPPYGLPLGQHSSHCSVYSALQSIVCTLHSAVSVL